MKVDETLIVALAHIYAAMTKKAPSTVLDAWEDMVKERYNIATPVRAGKDDAAFATAKEIYAAYPNKCYKPSLRRIVKSPSKDIPAIVDLIKGYGDEDVRGAFDEFLQRDEFLPDLCRAVRKVKDMLEDKTLSGGNVFEQDRPDY